MENKIITALASILFIPIFIIIGGFFHFFILFLSPYVFFFDILLSNNMFYFISMVLGTCLIPAIIAGSLITNIYKKYDPKIILIIPFIYLMYCFVYFAINTDISIFNELGFLRALYSYSSYIIAFLFFYGFIENDSKKRDLRKPQ